VTSSTGKKGVNEDLLESYSEKKHLTKRIASGTIRVRQETYLECLARKLRKFYYPIGEKETEGDVERERIGPLLRSTQGRKL